MIHITPDQFRQLVEQSVQTIPKRYAAHLQNVAFMVDDLPTPAQLERGGILHGSQTLLGLYEGIPLPLRNNGYSGVLPDMITVFQRPHELMAHSLAELAQAVHQTVWHEVAHYFGLDHGQIKALES